MIKKELIRKKNYQDDKLYRRFEDISFYNDDILYNYGIR